MLLANTFRNAYSEHFLTVFHSSLVNRVNYQRFGRGRGRGAQLQVEQTRVALIETRLVQIFQTDFRLDRRVGRDHFDERVRVSDGRQVIRYERLQSVLDFRLLRVVAVGNDTQTSLRHTSPRFAREIYRRARTHVCMYLNTSLMSCDKFSWSTSLL